mgnify:CR=1 FL=1
MLKCPNDPEHDTFVMVAMVPETWFLDKDGDCEYAEEQQGGHIESDLATARCQICSVLVEIVDEADEE